MKSGELTKITLSLAGTGVKCVVDLCAAPGSWSQVSFCPSVPNNFLVYITMLALAGFEPEPLCTSKAITWLQLASKYQCESAAVKIRLLI
jgi:23S rRNA U2552 (ribose-2'-O)-methylase RlmE/FtsJ